MSLTTLRTELEAVLADHLGTYVDVSTNPERTVGPAFWTGADVPEKYRVRGKGLEAILNFAGLELDPRESEEVGFSGTASYRLTLIMHAQGGSVEESLYTVLAVRSDAEPQPLVPDSDLSTEQIGVIFTERINR